MFWSRTSWLRFRMLMTVALVDVVPPKLVQMLVDDALRDGSLRAWQHHEGRWRGYVTYSVGVGLQHFAWIDQDRLRHLAAR